MKCSTNGALLHHKVPGQFFKIGLTWLSHTVSYLEALVCCQCIETSDWYFIQVV